MNPTEPTTARRAAWQGVAEPDVVWAESGIDALIWADTEPYAEVLSPARAGLTDAPDDELLWLGRS